MSYLVRRRDGATSVVSAVGRIVRVLLVTDFYPPYPGGMERHVKTLALHLMEHGHVVAVATTAGIAPSPAPVWPGAGVRG